MEKYTKTHKADLGSDWLLCPLHPISLGVGEREREREKQRQRGTICKDRRPSPSLSETQQEASKTQQSPAEPSAGPRGNAKAH